MERAAFAASQLRKEPIGLPPCSAAPWRGALFRPAHRCFMRCWS